MATVTEQERVRITMSNRGGGQVTVSGLTEAEVERLQGCIDTGAYWVRSEEGRLAIVESHEPSPAPHDPEMHPFWRPPSRRELQESHLIFDLDTGVPQHSSPSFCIEGLCGYGYTPKEYERCSKVLESFGFECLRSRRGKDGRFWEQWCLPGLWAAKGDLEQFLLENKINSYGALEREVLADVGHFIFKRAPFGSLRVTTQLLAMAVPD